MEFIRLIFRRWLSEDVIGIEEVVPKLWEVDWVDGVDGVDPAFAGMQGKHGYAFPGIEAISFCV